MTLKSLSNGKTRITGTLTDADSAAGIAGRRLTFKANGRSVGSAVTNSAGTASVAVKVKKGQTATASFAGDDFYLASQGSKKK